MMLASGYSHSLFLDSLGSVWSCGNNLLCGLGLGHTTDKLTPDKINNLPPIISVSAGYHFSLFVDANGRVWSCGDNEHGQLGLGDRRLRSIPEQIQYMPKITSAIAVGRSSIFLDWRGSVWTCGWGFYGQLGLNDDITCKTKAEKIPGLPKIKSIAGGWSHSLFLDCKGSVWSCGYNAEGCLGLGDTENRKKAEKIQGLPKIKSMAGGVHWSIFVDEQVNVWVCGGNEKGELGMGHTTQINSPQKNNDLSGIVAVGGGDGNYSVFLDNAGNIYTCGCNEYGQLGLEDTEDRHTPQKVNNVPPMCSISQCNTAGGYLQIVDEEGRVWSCGYNRSSRLGLGHTKPTCTFQRINQTIVKSKQHLEQGANAAKEEPKEEAGWEWEQASKGQKQGAGCKMETVVNWQKEKANTKFINKDMGACVECASGYEHSLFLDPLGSVWSCGNNQHRQLGLGHRTYKLAPEKINNLPPINSVSAGAHFSLFVDANGKVWSCGYNLEDRMESRKDKKRNIPEQIQKIANLPKIKSAIALGQSSLFIDCEGSVWACGHNKHGQLGLGDTTHRNKAEKIQGLPAIKSMAGGVHWSMFVDEQGNVWVCGGNERGELGLGDTTHRSKAEKIQGLPAIKSMAG